MSARTVAASAALVLAATGCASAGRPPLTRPGFAAALPALW